MAKIAYFNETILWPIIFSMRKYIMADSF